MKTKTLIYPILAAITVSVGIAVFAKHKDWWIYPAFHSVVASVYKYPESVKFRGNSMPNADVLCGEANAKNGYGAYGGYKHFIATKDGAVYLEGQGRVRSSGQNSGVDEATEEMQLETAALQLQNKRFELRNEQAKANLPQDEKLSDTEAIEQARTIAFDRAWKARCG